LELPQTFQVFWFPAVTQLAVKGKNKVQVAELRKCGFQSHLSEIDVIFWMTTFEMSSSDDDV
jgi:hypothetical protein